MSARRVTRFLCPACQDLQLVKEMFDGVVVLACGHHRPTLLESAPGRVSFEQLVSKAVADRKLAHRLFPAGRELELTSQKIRWITQE